MANENLEERLTGLRRRQPNATGIARQPVPATTGIRRVSAQPAAPFNPSQFQRGVARGVYGLEQAAAGAVAAGAAAVGADALREDAEELAASRAQAATEVPQPRVARIADVQSPGDLADWAMQGLGQLAPYAITTPIGGGVGAGVGAGILRAAGQTALRQGAKRGALAGAATSTITPEIGGQYTEQREAGVEPGLAAAASIPGGIAAGAIDLVPQVRALRAVTQPGTRSLRRIAGESLIAEPATEATQDGIAIASRATVDPNFEVFTEENAARLGEAAALGALGGGVLGAGAAAGAAVNRRAQNISQDRAAVEARINALKERFKRAPDGEVMESRAFDYDAVRTQLDDVQARVRAGDITPEEASREAQRITASLPDVEGSSLDIQTDDAIGNPDFTDGGQSGEDEAQFRSTRVEPEGDADYMFDKQGRAYQSSAANQYLHEGRGFEGNALENRLAKLREKEDGYVYRPVSVREVLSAELQQQGRSPQEVGAALTRMAQRRYQEERAKNPRWDELYNPDDPVSFLDNFHVIERRGVQQTLSPQGDLDLSDADMVPEPTVADRRKRAALAAKAKAGDKEAAAQIKILDYTYENKRILRDPPRVGLMRNRREFPVQMKDGKRQNVNAMALTVAMMRRMQSGEKLTAGTAPAPKRVAEAFLAGLTSLEKRGVDIGALRIPDNTIVFSKRTEGGGLRNYTYGEIRRSGREQFEQRVRDLEREVALAQDAFDQQRGRQAASLQDVARGAPLTSETKAAQRRLQQATSQLEAARSMLASNPLTDEEKATRTIIRGPKRKAQAEAAGDLERARYIEERIEAAKLFLAGKREKEQQKEAALAERRDKESGGQVAVRTDDPRLKATPQTKEDVLEQQRLLNRDENVAQIEAAELAELKALRKQDFDYDSYSLPVLKQIAGIKGLLAQVGSLTPAQLRSRYAEVMGFEPGRGRTDAELIKSLNAKLGALLQYKKPKIYESRGTEQSSDPAAEPEQGLVARLKGWLAGLKLPHKVRLVSLEEFGLSTTAQAAAVMRNGEVLIYVNPNLKGAQAVAVLAHELGHAVKLSVFNTLSEAQQRAVLIEYDRWRQAFSRDGVTAAELLASKKPVDLLQSADTRDQDYLLDFDEWFADQTARWLLGETKPPKGPVEGFFAKVADALRRLVGIVDKTDPEWGGSVFSVLEAMTGVGTGWDSSQSPLEILRAKALTLSPAIQKEIRKIFPQRPDLDPADAAWLSVLNGNQTHTEAFRLALEELLPVLLSKKRLAGLRKKAPNGDIARAFQEWAFGGKPDGELAGEFRRLHEQLERTFETLVDQDVMDTLWQGQAELREHLTSVAPGAAQLRAMGTRRASGFFGKAWEKVRGGTSTLFVAADARLRASKNASLIEIAKHFHVRPGEAAPQTYVEAKTERMGEFINRARRIFEGKDKAFGEAVLKVLHNPNGELGQAADDVKQAAQRTWRLMREMRSYLVAAGVEVGDRGEQYFPWIFDTEYLGRNRDAFIQLIDQPKFAQALEELTIRLGRKMDGDRLYSHFMGEMDGNVDVLPSSDPHAANFRSLNQRILAFIEEHGDDSDRAELAKFFQKDLGLTLGLYIDRAVKQAEYVRRFGADNEKLTALLERAANEGATVDELTLANNLVLAHVGLLGGQTAMKLARVLGIKPPKYGRPIDPRLQRAQGWMMVYQNLRILGLATITSIADPIGIAVRTGDFNVAFRAFRDGLAASMSQHKEDLTELAQALGVVDYTLTNEALGWEYGGVYITGKAKKINDTFFRVIGLQSWTRTTRVMALAAGQSFLFKHATNPNKHSARFLTELGLDAADIKTENGQLKILTRAERRAATPEEVARDDKVRSALVRFVDGAILRPNASQRPLFASDPHYALVFHLKGFMYAFHETVLRRVAHEAQNGNLVPIMAVGAFIPAMIAGDVLRDLIRHGGIPSHKENWTALDYMQEGLHRSGVAGAYGTMGLDVLKDYNMGGVSVLGPTIDQLANPDLGESYPGQNLFKYWVN